MPPPPCVVLDRSEAALVASFGHLNERRCGFVRELERRCGFVRGLAYARIRKRLDKYRESKMTLPEWRCMARGLIANVQ